MNHHKHASTSNPENWAVSFTLLKHRGPILMIIKLLNNIGLELAIGIPTHLSGCYDIWSQRVVSYSTSHIQDPHHPWTIICHLYNVTSSLRHTLLGNERKGPNTEELMPRKEFLTLSKVIINSCGQKKLHKIDQLLHPINS